MEQAIFTLVDEEKERGAKLCGMDSHGNQVASGVYLYQI
jgi:hypothetical protein